jgi:hypothetical protein
LRSRFRPTSRSRSRVDVPLTLVRKWKESGENPHVFIQVRPAATTELDFKSSNQTPTQNRIQGAETTSLEHPRGVGPWSRSEVAGELERRFTAVDLKFNVIAVSVVCWLNVSPIHFHPVKLTMRGFRPKENPFRKFLFHAWLLMAAVREAALVVTVVHWVTVVDTRSELWATQELYRLLLVIIVGFVCIGLFWGYWGVAVLQLNTHCIIFNGLLEYLSKDRGHKQENQNLTSGHGVRQWLKKLRHSSFLELVLVFLPFLIYSLMGIAPLLMIFDPSQPFLLTSYVHPLQVNVGSSLVAYVTLAALDMLFLFFYMTCIYYAVFFMLLFIHRIREETTIVQNSLRSVRSRSNIARAL